MKPNYYVFILCLLFALSFHVYAQKGNNEFEKRRVEARLNDVNAAGLVAALHGDDASIINQIQTLFTTAGTLIPVKGSAMEIDNLKDSINSNIQGITDRGNGNMGPNAAVIFLYRDITLTTIGGGTVAPTPAKIDFTSLKTLIYNKNKNITTISNYLLETKKIYLVFIDMSDEYYKANDQDNDKKLSNSTIKIEYRNSLLKQSFIDLRGAFGMMGGGSNATNTVKLTLVEIESRRIKAPCDLIVSNKAFDKDKSFTIHERNVATFQIGVENSKYRLNNFAITGGNLVVSPNGDQKENWKSNLKALFEIHLPRDIDNFRPLWKDLTTFDRPALKWIYDFIFSRIGIYGGTKLSKDPLTNLYAGINYAITKEFYVNLGWSWENEVVPQITQIGNISSLKEAKEFAIRRYSGGKFSWGLSFSPSAVVKMLGLKAKE